ncbi:glycosyltransferase family 25 protein [Sphingomonas sp. 1P08PE]|uniref:glycosyltransferase family 25 protein n=1 Tax=Sphingomonas sp. 1P08PE TaxID=554122 RepID=UPI00399FED7A
MTMTAAGRILAETFDRIVIVNLARRPDRRREMVEQLARIGLSFDHPKVLRFDACTFDDPAGFPTPGTRGCFHSHLGVWRDAAKRGDRSVLLLEDDLDFVDDIDRRLPAAMAALAERDWTMFYGGVLQWTPAAEATSPLALAGADEPIMGGHFVAVRGDAIADLASYLTAILTRPAGCPDGGPMHVDGAYGWFRKANPSLQTWVAHPDLGVQRSSRTDIHQLGWKDRLPGVRQLTSTARRLRRALR